MSKEAREVLKHQGMNEAEIDQALVDIKNSLQAYREGRFISWDELKAQLNLSENAEPSIPVSALRQEREWLEAQLECEKAIGRDGTYPVDSEHIGEVRIVQLKAQINTLSILIERYAPMRPTEDECRTPDCLEVRPEEWKGCCRGQDTTFTVLPPMWIPEEEGQAELRKWQREPPYPRDPARDGLD